jgi:hypothetical protein
MGHFFKTKCVDSRANVHNLASTSVSFTLTPVQGLNLALTHTKWITVQVSTAGFVHLCRQHPAPVTKDDILEK